METAERGPRERCDRLAEMVWHLTECDPRLAKAAVDAAPGPLPGHDEALLVVARALCRLRRIDLPDTLDLTEKVDLRDRVTERTTVRSPQT